MAKILLDEEPKNAAECSFFHDYDSEGYAECELNTSHDLMKAYLCRCEFGDAHGKKHFDFFRMSIL